MLLEREHRLCGDEIRRPIRAATRLAIVLIGALSLVPFVAAQSPWTSGERPDESDADYSVYSIRRSDTSGSATI